ncbi:MAG: DegV family protein [Chloroflexi bacterium]|nr:DegV family protein [Chloroflexota bacterium]
MAVKIVTDSTCDLPRELASQLDITVVPLTVRFGTESYLDGVDLTPGEFFHKLVTGQVLPTTAAPAPGAFAEVYRKLLDQGHEVLSIHISNKLSATYNAALLGKEAVGAARSVEVIDSLSVSMGLGLLALAAARSAAAGAGLKEVSKLVREKMQAVRLYAAFDTLEYLKKGGRIGRATAFLGSLLNLKPMIVIREGEVHPLERVRTRAKAVGRLCDLVEGCPSVEELVVLHSTTQDEAEELAQRMEARLPGKRVHRAQFGPVLGTYTGPGILAIGFIEGT